MNDDCRALPHSLEAERAILGAILLDNQELDTALAAGLRPEDFYRDAHQRIYRAVLGLHARQAGFDLVTMKDALERSGDLEHVTVSYLASVLDGGVRTINMPHYLGLVQDAAARRALIREARRVIEQALAGEASAPAITDGAITRLLAVGQAGVSGLVEGPDLAREAVAYLEELAERRRDGRTSGVSTGFVELDDMLDGLQPGQLIVLAGRTSDGKTSLATQFALASGSCAFFSCEMQRIELAVRQLAVLGRVDGWALRRGYLSRGESARVSEALSRLAECGVAVDDTAAITLAQIRARARQRQVRRGLRLIVVDYLQLLTADTGRKRDTTREQEVTSVSRGLKAIAKDLQVPVLALSQLNRAARADEEPTLSHLRESGAIEQDANIVLLLHRSGGQTAATAGDVQVIVAKNRNGRTGTVTLRWYPAETRFADPPPAEIPGDPAGGMACLPGGVR
jgi:replicative DNA helicase